MVNGVAIAISNPISDQGKPKTPKEAAKKSKTGKTKVASSPLGKAFDSAQYTLQSAASSAVDRVQEVGKDARSKAEKLKNTLVKRKGIDDVIASAFADGEWTVYSKDMMVDFWFQ
eukprot:g103.t1